MAERSILWTTGAGGDGASTYTQDDLVGWLRRTFSPNSANQGPLRAYLNEMLVSSGAGNVSVATGGASVYGFPYENTSAVVVAIPTPASNTRIDRIVLRASWAAKTVRITRIAGTEGAAAPAIVQTPGTTYDVPLAQVSITTGGVITVTDQREFLQGGFALNGANLINSSVGFNALVNGAVSGIKIGAQVPIVTQRVGGSGTDWGSPGNTLQAVNSNVDIQAGAFTYNAPVGVSSAGVKSFAHAFATGGPVLVATIAPGVATYDVGVTIVSAGNGTFELAVINNSGATRLVAIHWIAIGPRT
jgi:hypothetical protein